MWKPALLLAFWTFQVPAERPVVELSSSRLEAGDQGWFALVLEFTIKEGWYLYAHKPASDQVVPTILTARFEPPVRDLQISYPKGQLKPDPVGDGEVNVYEGKLRVTVTWRRADPHPAPSAVDLTLRFQPCTSDACLAPQTKSWRVRLKP